jgi:hypothetical protein
MPIAARPFPHRRALACGLALALAGSSLDDAARASGAPAPAGANLVVTNCNDSGNGSLRAAMTAATNNTTITFGALACSTITLTTGALTDPNTDSLKILAQPQIVAGRPQPTITIDGSGSSRIIEHHSGGELELRGLTLRNGRANDGKGGCIYAEGRVTATAVTVSGCVAAAPGAGNATGGGIWSNDTVDLRVSTISGNSARADGGGYAYGGGVFSTYGVYIAYSTIEYNQTTGFGYGGGVSVVGPAIIRSSLVTGNVASYGAGLALWGGSVGPGDVQVVNSTVAQNHATGFAGGIETSAELYVIGSTIAGNFGDHATDAGGIVVEGAHALTLHSSIVANNTQAGVAKDISGAASISGSANLVGVSTAALPAGTLTGDPRLRPLALAGGQTKVMTLMSDSPAINTGSNPLGSACDQRSGNYVDGGFVSLYPRALGSAPDIGAFESGLGNAIFANGFDGSDAALRCYPDQRPASG